MSYVVAFNSRKILVINPPMGWGSKSGNSDVWRKSSSCNIVSCFILIEPKSKCGPLYILYFTAFKIFTEHTVGADDYLFMVTREEVFSPLPSRSPSPSSEFSFAGEEKTKLARKTTKNIFKFALINCSLRRNGNIHVLWWKQKIYVETINVQMVKIFVATVFLVPNSATNPLSRQPKPFHNALCNHLWA